MSSHDEVPRTPDRRSGRSGLSHSVSQSLFKHPGNKLAADVTGFSAVKPSRNKNKNDSSLNMGGMVNRSTSQLNVALDQMQLNKLQNSSRMMQKERSVNGSLSKAQSQASFSRIHKMTEDRATAFNSELTLKLSYEWKNIYRSLLSMDILQKG